MELIDLSQSIEPQMPVYPGDRAVKLSQSNFYFKDKYNNHFLETGMHVGTHVDGPMHMAETNRYISSFPLESFCGEGCVIESKDMKVITKCNEYLDIIIRKSCSVVLIHTGMDAFYGQPKYYNEHPVIDIPFCQMLVENNIKMIGIDAPSPDRYPFEIHKYLFSKNIVILENLTNLDKIGVGTKFEVFAFPLKIQADSSMVRAVGRIY